MYTITKARQIANDSGADKGGDLYEAIRETAASLAGTEITLHEAAAQIRSTLDLVQGKLTHGEQGNARLNDLGELQRASQDYDNAVVKFSGLERQLAVLLRLAKQD